jgi:hypothetical protein
MPDDPRVRCFLIVYLPGFFYSLPYPSAFINDDIDFISAQFAGAMLCRNIVCFRKINFID